MKTLIARFWNKVYQVFAGHKDTPDLEETPEIDPVNISEQPAEQSRYSRRLKKRLKSKDLAEQQEIFEFMPDRIVSKPAGRIRQPWSLKKKILISVLGAVLVLMIGSGAYAYAILQNPMGQFENVAQQFERPVMKTQSPTQGQTEDAADMTDSISPTPNEYDNLLSQADMSLLNKIVNVLLIGVDHAVERDTWNGKKAFHADVMLVLAINTDTGTVDMISLPRDTYSEIPGVKGRYKLNASIDCGGGWPTEGGFNKVCESAEWMLGGIPVDYYYAVDMNAVKGLADTIDGVDYNVDVDFMMQGRSYKKGLQHLDGQGVLDYLRVRKELGELSGDKNRVDRQKRMLVAIFDKLKAANLLVKIPDLMGAFDGNLYTNTTLAQTAGLAAFAYNVDSKNIRIHSMSGQQRMVYNWSFCLTDQNARVKLIKDVYGVDVPVYKDFVSSTIISKWNALESGAVRRGAKSVLSKVKAKLDADAKLPIYGEPTPTPAPTATSPAKTPKPPVNTPTPPVNTPTPPVDTPKPPVDTPKPPVDTPKPPVDTPTPSTETSKPPADTPVPPTDTPTGLSGTVSVRAMISPIGLQFITLKTGAPKGYQQYTDAERSFYNHVCGEVNSASTEHLKSDVASLCSMFGVGVPSYRVNWESSNEIDVDFR